MYLDEVTFPVDGKVSYAQMPRIFDQQSLERYIDREINDRALCFGAHGLDCYYCVDFTQDPNSWLIHCALKIELDGNYRLSGGSLGRRPGHAFNRAMRALHLEILSEKLTVATPIKTLVYLPPSPKSLPMVLPGAA